MLKFILPFISLILLNCEKPFGQPAEKYQAEIKQVAVSFIASLDDFQKRRALNEFNDSNRTVWNNLPVGMRPRAGISVGNMRNDQRKLFHRLLSVSLSSQGYLKATSIMQLDNLLNQYYDSLLYKKEIDSKTYNEIRALEWSTRNFYLAFFGEPTNKNWGFKVEGHHLSINFTFSKNQLSVTPMFVGTDPAEYQISEYAGLRILGQEEDLGMRMMGLLSPAQLKKATMNTGVPRDIITAAESGKRLVDDWGLQAAEMTKEQQAVLQYIIREFVFNLEYDKAVTEYDKIVKAGISKIYFGWIGPVDEEKPHYYVLNGPTFLIELDNSGPGGNGNHIHAIWRQKGNEYGEDVLKRHYQAEH